MTLTCDPTEAKMGNVKSVVWKFNKVVIKSDRHKQYISGGQYKLEVRTVILGDAGKLKTNLPS